MATRKEMFVEMAEHFEGLGETEMAEFCRKNVESLEKAAARPKGVSKSTKESIEFAKAVYAWMIETDAESYTNKDVAAGMECSSQKAAAALKRLVGGVEDEDGTLRINRDEGEKPKDGAIYTIA